VIPFHEALLAGPVLLMDGGMATELFKQGLGFEEPAEAWNLSQAETVRGVHEAYLASGATCILTNTFQANPRALAKHGLENRLEEILRAAVRIAREARGPNRYVLASIGPLGIPYDSAFLDRVIPCLDGVDGILLETFGDVDALWLVKYGVLPRLAEKNVPVLLSLSFARSESGVVGTLAGQSADAIGRMAVQYELSALGLNCGKDMSLANATSVIRDYRQGTRLPTFARPNAGTPVQTATGLEFPLGSADFAAWVPEVLREGIRMVGGCCGTTPQTIAAMREVLDRWSGAEEVW
jgi:methionine synthase I (cobalamin-dependent)